MENEIITGKLTYREVEFSFVFDGKELRLISPKEKRHEIEMEWIMHPIGNGAYTFGGDLKMEAPYLVGECNENGHRYIFFTQQGEHIGSKNSILFIDVIAYMEYSILFLIMSKAVLKHCMRGRKHVVYMLSKVFYLSAG